MQLDCAVGQTEFAGNVLVGQPFAYQSEHVLLPRSERNAQRVRALSRWEVGGVIGMQRGGGGVARAVTFQGVVKQGSDGLPCSVLVAPNIEKRYHREPWVRVAQHMQAVKVLEVARACACQQQVKPREQRIGMYDLRKRARLFNKLATGAEGKQLGDRRVKSVSQADCECYAVRSVLHHDLALRDPPVTRQDGLSCSDP